MKFETIYTDFKNLFPEKSDEFLKSEKESLIYNDGDELSYVSFGLVIMPFVFEPLKSNDKSRLEKAFSFFLKKWRIVKMTIYKDYCNLRYWKT